MNLDASRTAAQQPAPSYPDICFAADNFEDGIDEMVCARCTWDAVYSTSCAAVPDTVAPRVSVLPACYHAHRAGLCSQGDQLCLCRSWRTRTSATPSCWRRALASPLRCRRLRARNRRCAAWITQPHSIRTLARQMLDDHGHPRLDVTPCIHVSLTRLSDTDAQLSGSGTTPGRKA